MFKLIIICCVISFAYGQYVGKCPPVDGKYPVYLPDAKCCVKFYECSNGVSIQLRCALGTFFDDRKLICDTNVKCGRRRRICA